MKKMLLMILFVCKLSMAQSVAIGIGTASVNGVSYSCPSGNISVINNQVFCDNVLQTDNENQSEPCGDKSKVKRHINPDGNEGGYVLKNFKPSPDLLLYLDPKAEICGDYQLSGLIFVSGTSLRGKGIIRGDGLHGVIIQGARVNDFIDIIGDGIEVSGGIFNDRLFLRNQAKVSGGIFNGRLGVQDEGSITGGIFNADIEVHDNARITGGIFNGDLTLNGDQHIAGGIHQ